MKVSDLPDPVTAAKADWIPGTTWLGFTPQGIGPDARSKCEATVLRQFGKGYVLERVTSSFGAPNDRFRDDARVASDREAHAKYADGLVAIHRLRHSSVSLEKIVGPEEFRWLQDVWANEDRNRWSVAFPIVETFRIIGAPKAKAVFGPEIHARLFQSQSAVLRPLDDDARLCLDDLEITSEVAPNVELLLDQEIQAAERSEVDPKVERDIARDLAGAWEGQAEERKRKLKRRAAWLAERFVRQRSKAGALTCDHCAFDARVVEEIRGARKRSCFDVHHKALVGDGIRYTTLSDFLLLCPTCHRIEHLRMKFRRIDDGAS